MTIQPLQKVHKACLRLAVPSAIALQTAVVGAAVSEFIATQPQFSNTRVASAQSSQVQAAENAVVYIETNRGQASGVVINPEGLIITNADVVEGVRRINVTIRGREMQAEVVSIGNSRCLDLALLQVEGVRDLSAIALADATSIYQNQTVYAIGYPDPLQNDSATITQGIISNIHPNQGVIQLEDPINPGNSGGAIVDDNANIIGIAASRLNGGDDNHFAVSVDKMRAFLEAYRQGAPPLVGQAIMPGSQPDGDALIQSIRLDGVETQGLWQTGDSQFCGDDSLADLYRFDAQAGENIMLNLVSQDIGAYLFLLAPDGTVIAHYGSQERNQAAIILEKLPITGTYTVVANAAQPNQSGRYQIRATQPILVEQGLIHNNIAPCSENGRRCIAYQFYGRTRQGITVLFHNAEFDPHVILLSSDGDVVAEGWPNPGSGANLTLSEAGWFTLVISTCQPEDIGSFRVSVHETQTLNPPTEVSQP